MKKYQCCGIMRLCSSLTVYKYIEIYIEICVYMYVHAAVWVLCERFVSFTVVSEVQMVFEDSSPQSGLKTNIYFIVLMSFHHSYLDIKIEINKLIKLFIISFKKKKTNFKILIQNTLKIVSLPRM